MKKQPTKGKISSKIAGRGSANRKCLLTLVGFSCNNNCLVCSVKDRKQFYPDRTTDQIISDLAKNKKKGFDQVEFTGGEPSIRQDIFLLVRTAKKLGYQQIAFSTNGRLFSYDSFCQKIIEAGLNKITFSVLGPDKKTHDAITRTPGSFEQIVQGIKNTKRFPQTHINVSSVICRLNFRDLKKFGEFILSLNINGWYLLDLIPDGHASLFYSQLAVRLPQLNKELNRLQAIAPQFKELGFFDFPFCLLAPSLRQAPNVRLINTKQRLDDYRQIGYDPKRLKKNKKGFYQDIHRQNVDFCQRCRYYKECGGLWKEYLERFGDKELSRLAKKNACLL